MRVRNASNGAQDSEGVSYTIRTAGGAAPAGSLFVVACKPSTSLPSGAKPRDSATRRTACQVGFRDRSAPKTSTLRRPFAGRVKNALLLRPSRGEGQAAGRANRRTCKTRGWLWQNPTDSPTRKTLPNSAGTRRRRMQTRFRVWRREAAAAAHARSVLRGRL